MSLVKGLLEPSEHQIQVAYFDWIKVMTQNDWRYHNIWATPNASKMSFALANFMQAEGRRAGALDVNIAVPAGGYHGAFIEHKTRKGALTEEQVNFVNRLRACGYFVLISRSAETSIDFTECYMNDDEVTRFYVDV